MWNQALSARHSNDSFEFPNKTYDFEFLLYSFPGDTNIWSNVFPFFAGVVNVIILYYPLFDAFHPLSRGWNFIHS